jgi:hypothetical protein
LAQSKTTVGPVSQVTAFKKKQKALFRWDIGPGKALFAMSVDPMRISGGGRRYRF